MRKVCNNCGEGFDTERKDKKFCKYACSDEYHKEKWKARRHLFKGRLINDN